VFKEVIDMGLKVKSIQQGQEQNAKQEQYMPAKASRNVQRLKSEMADIVVDGEQLWIRRAIQQLLGLIKKQEVEEILRKQRK
jgi:hypothetical protein